MRVVEGVRVGYNKQETAMRQIREDSGKEGPGKHIEQMNKNMEEEQMERG